jgi:CPA2 family monovalent cation:H+ antiporter-2
MGDFFSKLFSAGHGTQSLATSNYFSLIDALIILFFAIVVVLLFKKLKLSPVIGYIAAGAIIGPYGFNLTGYNDVTKSLAEFGVVFLLFSIALELTLERLLSMKRLILMLGSSQFVITTAVFYIASYFFVQNHISAFIIGSALAMSSTAIVLRIISDTHQSNTPVGRVSLSVLLFQDLAVIPLFILIPLLNSTDINFFSVGFSIISNSVIALLLILVIGRFILKPAFRFIVSSDNNDLFITATLFIILSSAFITSQLGLSLALGAFIAGLIVAETEFQTKVHSIIDPFKTLFLGFFFITEIGMHFDLTLLVSNFFLIFLGAIGLITVKASIIYLLCFRIKGKVGLSINSALLLSQAGEFAFILFEMAKSNSFLTEYQFQNLSIVVGISMAITPLLAGLGKKLENKFAIKEKDQTLPIEYNQVIVAGLGRTGETIIKILQKKKINYLAIDNDSRRVSKYYKKNYPAYIGDITDPKFLDHLKLDSAAAVILTITDYKELSKAVRLIAKNYPNTELVVRALDLEQYEKLKKLGAHTIIPEVQEVGIKLSREILQLVGSEEEDIQNIINEYRESEFKVG